jgi:hypothetical protein
MRKRGWAARAVGVWLSFATAAHADPTDTAEPAGYKSNATAEPQRSLPDELPLLPVPPATPKPATPPASGPVSSGGPEYNPALMYLPDRIPERTGPPCPCGPPGTFWLRPEFLFAATNSRLLPPLVTTGPPATVLFGDQSYNDGMYPALRLDAGLWLDNCNTLGVEAAFLYLGRQHSDFSENSTGEPVLARPYVNAVTGQPWAVLIAYPNLAEGGVHAFTAHEVLGAELDGRFNIYCGGSWRFDALAGYRFVYFEDRLGVDTVSGRPGSTTTTSVSDRFEADNYFHGGQIGLSGTLRGGRFSLETFGKVALGVSHKVVTINGQTSTSVAGGPPTDTPGGLLAQASNIGHYGIDDFAVVPEAGLNFGVRVTEKVTAVAGYSFLYWNNVARAGDQVDLVLVPPGAPGSGTTGHPAFPNKTTELWVQALSLGLEVRY